MQLMQKLSPGLYLRTQAIYSTAVHIEIKANNTLTTADILIAGTGVLGEQVLPPPIQLAGEMVWLQLKFCRDIKESQKETDYKHTCCNNCTACVTACNVHVVYPSRAREE